MSPHFKAALWMAGWLTASLALTIAGRELGRDIPVFEIMLMRSLIAVAILSPLVAMSGGFFGRTARPGLHLVRNTVHYSAQYAWFSALTLIPIAQVVSIEFTLPIWVAVLAALFLEERLTAIKVAATLT